MRVLNDFQCPSGHINEHLVDNTTTSVACQYCGSDATRVLRPVRSQLDPFRGHFPTAADQWVKRREKRQAEERKHSSFDPSDA